MQVTNCGQMNQNMEEECRHFRSGEELDKLLLVAKTLVLEISGALHVEYPKSISLFFLSLRWSSNVCCGPARCSLFLPLPIVQNHEYFCLVVYCLIVTSLSKKDGDLSDDSFFFVFSLMGIHESSTNSGEPSRFTQDLNEACSFVFLFFIEGICTTAVCIASPPHATCLPYCYTVERNFILSCFGDTVAVLAVVLHCIMAWIRNKILSVVVAGAAAVSEEYKNGN